MAVCRNLGRYWCEALMSGSFLLLASIILAPLLG
jgi:hypothetical protein